MTKKRLIDADILENKICKWLDEIKSDKNKGYACEIYEADGAIEALETVIAEIEEMPIIDVPKSNVGKWTPIAFGYRCSECGFEIGSLSKYCGCNYCPNCGARMDGEKNE